MTLMKTDFEYLEGSVNPQIQWTLKRVALLIITDTQTCFDQIVAK